MKILSLMDTNGCVPFFIFNNSFLGGSFGLIGLDGCFAGYFAGIVILNYLLYNIKGYYFTCF